MPIIDAIQEEIKREDFFNRLRKSLPFIIAIAIAILIGTGIYVWRQEVAEAQLIKDEAVYQEALECISEGMFSKAEQLLTSLTGSRVESLALLQLGHLYRAQYRLTDASGVLKKMKDNYDVAIKRGYPLTIANFLSLSLVFQNPEYFSPLFKDQLTMVSSPKSTWFVVGAAYGALKSYDTKNTEDIRTSFSLWDQAALDTHSPMSWMAHYAKLAATAE